VLAAGKCPGGAPGGELLLEHRARDKGGDRRNQPLDAPQLDGLPVEEGASAKEHADRQGTHYTEDAEQKSDHGRHGEPETLSQGCQFSQARDLEGAGSIQVGTAGATSVAVKRADDVLGTATAGCAPIGAGDSGGRHGRPPKFVPSLIDCFCHKELFHRPFNRIASESPKQAIAKTASYELARGEGDDSAGQELRDPTLNFLILHNLARLGTYLVWFGGRSATRGVLSSRFSVLSQNESDFHENRELRTEN